MSPADRPDASGPAEVAADSGVPDAAGPADERRVRPVRCERCLSVLSVGHPWETVACSCGDLVVSGLPWAPRVRWASGPGGGWSELDPLPSLRDGGAEDPDDAPAGTRIGYLR